MKPDAFAAVMATGIVSIAAADHGYRIVSQIFLVMAAVALPVLVVLVAMAWRREAWEITDLDVALGLCTYVAACAVLAARLAEYHIALFVLAGMALQGWLSLAPVVARRLWRDRRALRDRAHGGWELASVATSGLAIVSADLKIVFLAMLFWVLAIGVYLLMTVLILRHVDMAQPDSWILMGGAAIATLAGDHIHKAGLESVWPVTVVTWIVATLWIPFLVFAMVRRFAGISWPTVFPLGMYSSATFAMFVETGWRWFTSVSLTFLWIALAAWVFVTASQLRTLSRR
ncbi:tellurite resistance/C4-dicarboxylate transporter family protein [Mycobacterium sp. MMS18-G62]